MTSIDTTFEALADATRRDLLHRLAAAGPMTATQLSARYEISRQAVVKHLGTLAEAGLVASERSGREVFYEFVPNKLSDAERWIARTGATWDKRLTALKQHLEAGE